MFHPGDIVSYGTNGVCEITEQKRVRLAGQPCDCLILKPVYDQSMTICVPCTSQVLLDRMRPLPTKEELLAMLHEPAPGPRGGRRCPQGAVPSGPGKAATAIGCCGWCGTSTPSTRPARPRARDFRPFDDRALHEAQNLLHSEFAYILGIEPNAVPSSLRQNWATNKTNKEIGFFYKRCT